MPKYILIVDDQKEISRLLRSALETIEQGLVVREAPSGEEAILETSRTKFDLLVADFRLPGITGVELMRKIRVRNPDIKVILITGVSEPRTRDEIAKSGADAYFFKPVPMGDFLATVERLLGMEQTVISAESPKAQPPERKTLSAILVTLRKSVNAAAAVLLNDRGRVVAQAGELPDPANEVQLIAALMTTYTSVQKVALLVEHDPTASLTAFRGQKMDYLFVPVGLIHAVLLAGRAIATGEALAKSADALGNAQPELEHALQSIGGTGALSPSVVDAYEAAQAARQPEPAPVDAPLEEEPPADLEDLFKALDTASLDPDAFWNEAVEKGPGFTLKDTLSFEEASKLGLTPDEV